MLAVLYQLEASQWLPEEEVRRNQFQQLQKLWSHAVANVPFYQDRMQQSGPGKGEALSLEKWQQVPILTRKMVQEKEKELLSRKIPGAHGQTHVIQTSGSTGRPVRVTITDYMNLLFKIFSMREHLWHQRDFSGKLTAIRFAPKGRAEYPGVAVENWGPSTAPLTETGPSVMLNSSTGISLQAKWLMKEDPDYLLSYPSNIRALAKYFKEHGYSLKRLREVRSFGEALGSKTRHACRGVWGVPVVDGYTTQETGFIAIQCPEHETHYHIQSEYNLVEIVDDQGSPCEPGETGRVLVTSLHNFAMPLIRYDVGDYAEMGSSCPCGRGLPVLKSILGRVRNMLTLPTGEKKWPNMGSWQYDDIAPIQQFQMIQKSLVAIEMRLVVKNPLGRDQEERLQEVVRASLGYPFQVSFSYFDEIPRSSSGKFEDFFSEIT